MSLQRWASALFSLVLAAPALAHFQVLLPSTDVVADVKQTTLNLKLKFTHPMDGKPVMQMERPAQFGVQSGGMKKDLLPTLKDAPIDGKSAFAASYKIPAPGVRIFYVEPKPYWEPAEHKYIKQYTKVVVGALGLFEGWDDLVGFPIEIKPLARPFGLWTGNVFRGVVLTKGKPLADATVEIEFYNEPRLVAPPNDAFVTQEVKTDANGIFAYAIPRAGWWGFAALTEGLEPLKAPDNSDAVVESGAVMWVRAVDMK